MPYHHHHHDDSEHRPAEMLSPATPSKAGRRRVRIAPLEFNNILPIVHIDDMDEIDINNTWYQKKDYNMMKISVITVVRKIMKGEKIEETNKQTARGLEYRTKAGAQRRNQNKLDALDAVVEEQSRQRETGDRDEEMMAEAYREVSKHCQEEARQLGLRDEAAIRKDMEKTRRKYFSKSPGRKTHGKSLSKTPRDAMKRPARAFSGLLKQAGFRRLPIPADDCPTPRAKPVMGLAA